MGMNSVPAEIQNLFEESQLIFIRKFPYTVSEEGQVKIHTTWAHHTHFYCISNKMQHQDTTKSEAEKIDSSRIRANRNLPTVNSEIGILL